MVHFSFSSLVCVALASARQGYLGDIILPPDEFPEDSMIASKHWDYARRSFDTILRNQGYNEESLSSFGSLISRHNITMRDGVNISTLMISPPVLKRHGAIVSRSPYGTPGTNMLSLVFLVLNGYTALLQDQRGTRDSGGVFDLWTQEGTDSTDVAEWIAQQRWSNGDVFYVGASADGMPGNLAVRDGGTRLKGEWLLVTAESGHSFVYPQGAYRQDLMHGYLGMMANNTHGSSKELVLPKVESNEAYDSWWEQITLCHHLSDPSEQPCYFSTIDWPIVDFAGWWDIFQQTLLTHWQGIRTLSNEVVRDQHVLIVGPLGHCSGGYSPLGPDSYHNADGTGLVVAGEIASELFKGNFNSTVRSRIGRVNLFVQASLHDDGNLSSGNYWTSLDDFPNPEPTQFFLSTDGVIADQPPVEAASQQYIYDPSAEDGATPMLGGNNLPGISGIHVCGAAEQQTKSNRTDILIFTSEPLSAEMPVVGKLSAKLYVSSSAKDTDFFVTVEDFAPNTEKSILVRYGMIRMRWRNSDTTTSPALEADQVYPVEIDLWTTAYIFPKGHSVRVSVSSAAYPYYSLNPNTGNALLVPDDEAVAASNTVYFSPDYPSSVSLPVVSASAIPENPDFAPVVASQIVV